MADKVLLTKFKSAHILKAYWIKKILKNLEAIIFINIWWNWLKRIKEGFNYDKWELQL